MNNQPVRINIELALISKLASRLDAIESRHSKLEEYVELLEDKLFQIEREQ